MGENYFRILKSYYYSLTNRSFDLEFSQDQLQYDAKLAFEGNFFSVDNYFVKDIFMHISFKTNQNIRYLSKIPF